MRKTLYASTLAIILAALATSAGAQTTRNATAARVAATQAAADTLPLPTADAVLTVDLRRLFTEVMPRALAGDAARAAQVNADVEQFKSRTGIDPREFDTVAAGARIVPLPSGAVKFDRVTAVARGRFRSDALVAAARTASKGTLAEQQYGGKTVYVSVINDQLKLFGVVKSHVRELAFAVLDANTLAVGEPEDVRAAIDAQAGRGRADMSILNFPRAATDFAAFAGRIPAGALSGVETGLPNVDRAIASIRGFYGTAGSTAAGLQLMTTLRAGSEADAKQLFNTADAMRLVAPGLISAAGDKAKWAQGLVNSLKLTQKGTEVQARLEVPQSEVATILRSL
ncbi:MAG TPA: hypothetical protein VJ866_19480 [Pyrinomonadaceae bacterium]|nr:hypothetical protein [Pyrinomonadaceae bacterium]